MPSRGAKTVAERDRLEAEDRAAVAEARRRPVDAAAARALWAYCLHVALDEASGRCLSTSAQNWTKAEARRAREWVGSPDFYAVCALAGLDGRAVRDRFETGAYAVGSARAVQIRGPRPE